MDAWRGASLLLLLALLDGDQGLGHLIVEFLISAWCGGGQHDGLGVAGLAQRAHHIQVLVEEHHIVHVLDVHPHTLQTLDLVDDTVGDLTSVVGLSLALQPGLLRVRLGLGLDLDALGVGLLPRGLLRFAGSSFLPKKQSVNYLPTIRS